MAKTKVAINGLGRIGRAFLKMAMARKELQVVAVNDLGDIENLAYLLKYDSAYGRSELKVKVVGKGDARSLEVDGQKIEFLSEKNPEDLPWGELGVDVVLESTGFFATYELSNAHIKAGAKRVVISAPVKVGDSPKEKGAVKGIKGATILMGINEEKFATCNISSNASCTTNASSPLIQILHEAIGVKKAMLNTVHGYTSSQKLVDSPEKKDFRRGRAAAQNIVPSSTGAALAVTQVVTDLKGKFDGIAMRVPVIVGSIADVTFVAKRKTTVEEVNDILKKASKDKRWKKVFAVTDEPLVSSDIAGQPYGSIADLGMTRVVDGDLVKVLAWYDNEVGYTSALVEHVVEAGKFV